MNTFKLVILFIAMMAFMVPAAHAESDRDKVNKGIRLFHSKEYKKAIHTFGAALNSEFNNAKLHYYLANCYVKTGKNSAAVREYRIALALSPDDEIGKFSQQALDDLLGKSSKESKSSSKPSIHKAQSELEKHLSKTFSSLDKQANDSVNSKAIQASKRANSYTKDGSHVVERTKLEMLRSMLDSGRKPKLNRSHKKQLRDIRRMYQMRARNQSKSNGRRVSAVQTSSENLKRLLQESQNDTGYRLKPQGTNLYIRNYGSD